MKIRTPKRLIYCLLALVVLFSFLNIKTAHAFTSLTRVDTVPSPNKFKIKTVVVDAGHGGFRTGASGLFSLEKNVTLQIAFKLQKAIEKDLSDIKVVMTRTTDDDILWQKRSDIANENKGDLFISIHCNSLADRKVRSKSGKITRVPNRSGKGVLLLVYGFHRTKEEEKAIKETRIEDEEEMNAGLNPNDPAAMIMLNEYKRKYRKQSIRFAGLLNAEFTGNDGRRSEGIREQGVLVLCHSAMPAVLIETGYINNPDEEKYLNSEEGQNEIVATIVRAIKSLKNEVEG